MATVIDLGVEKDHIESLTKASGVTALSEILWNSLDADATEIRVNYKKNALGGFESITVSDDGHGLNYEDAKQVFAKIGGSQKKIKTQSPEGRHYHGKEGKGRYKTLALGDLVEFASTYVSNGSFKQFTITIDRNHLSNSELSDLKTLQLGKGSKGYTVGINNVNNEKASEVFGTNGIRDIEEKFASYWTSYPTFKIYINNHELRFESLIKNSDEIELKVELDNLTYVFLIKVIEWNFDNKRKTYLCNTKGIPYMETSLGLRSSLPISIFIQSVYIEKLHRENTLGLEELDTTLSSVLKDARTFARNYVRKRLHEYSKEFIKDLKKQGIYPYQGEAENIVEETKRQVFDIVALQINEHLTSFSDQDVQSKKLTLALVGEALEHDSKNLKKILTEIIGLPDEKKNELAELLDNASLSNIIDAMTTVKNRLYFLNGLEQLIYNSELNEDVKERKHLHKIISKETWIFGDEYTYGVDDLSLKNVLKHYLKDALKRDDFEEIVESADNSELNKIPDVCLWQQYSLGSMGKENLIIELKKPTLDAGLQESMQIQGYASLVANDPRFPKDKTKWKFLLITKNIKGELDAQRKQSNRKMGHVLEHENVSVYILTWGDIITEARIRLEFIKEKLKLNLEENEKGLGYLKNKYKEYLPNEF